MMSQKSRAFLVLAGIFDVIALTLLANDKTAGASASVMGGFASLILVYFTDEKSPAAQSRIGQPPANSGTGLTHLEYNVLVAELARIDQQIEETKKFIAAAQDRKTEQSAEVTLADLQNERYDIEAKLRGT